MRDKLGRFIKGHPKPKNAYTFTKGHSGYRGSGWEHTKEAKARMSKICKEYYKTHPAPMKGKHHTEEAKRKIREANTRENNHGWKGGKIKTIKGYILINSPNHPFSNCSGYVLEHRLILEAHLNRYLDREETVHHINEIVDDNRLENLQLFKTSPEHTKHHRSLKSLSHLSHA